MLGAHAAERTTLTLTECPTVYTDRTIFRELIREKRKVNFRS